MLPTKLTKDAGKHQFETTLAIRHTCQRWIFGFVFEHSLMRCDNDDEVVMMAGVPFAQIENENESIKLIRKTFAV